MRQCSTKHQQIILETTYSFAIQSQYQAIKFLIPILNKELDLMSDLINLSDLWLFQMCKWHFEFIAKINSIKAKLCCKIEEGVFNFHFLMEVPCQTDVSSSLR